MVVGGIVFGHSDIKRTLNALVLLKLQGCPLFLVDKLLEGLLQVIENGLVRALNLLVININLHLQFLSLHNDRQEKGQEEKKSFHCVMD